MMRGAADVITWGWELLARQGTIGPRSRRARRFGGFGDGSAVCFPLTALYGEAYIRLGEKVIIGPYCTLSAGVMPGHVPDHDPVLTIGDRTLIVPRTIPDRLRRQLCRPGASHLPAVR